MGIELKKGTIKHLQEYVGEKIKERDFEDETLRERLILLMEEVGELARASRQVSAMNVDAKSGRKNTVGEEITDVLNMLFAVGIELGIDIEKEFYKKEAKVDKRFYKRSSK